MKKVTFIITIIATIFTFIPHIVKGQTKKHLKITLEDIQLTHPIFLMKSLTTSQLMVEGI